MVKVHPIEIASEDPKNTPTARKPRRLLFWKRLARSKKALLSSKGGAWLTEGRSKAPRREKKRLLPERGEATSAVGSGGKAASPFENINGHKKWRDAGDSKRERARGKRKTPPPVSRP